MPPPPPPPPHPPATPLPPPPPPRCVTDIPDNNTSHITEECHTASLGLRQQPAGARLID